ncbi:filamentous hemagglutinin family protein [Paraburkholderia sp. WSM4174]
MPSGAHAPNVIQTRNGLPQVDINKASNAGVSVNTYSQFDVQKNGAILNNSPVITNTQLAGQVSGNPNLSPGQSARIILNQVNSSSPSQLRGYLEVAGNRAEVVVANGSGIVVDGGGFINTTRGILTTGTPMLDAGGNLSGFKVTGGMITVQGAGLDATNIDQVDLISRAVQANAAIRANDLNVITGANQVNHDTLACQSSSSRSLTRAHNQERSHALRTACSVHAWHARWTILEATMHPVILRWAPIDLRFKKFIHSARVDRLTF